jgi:hypothetical protein
MTPKNEQNDLYAVLEARIAMYSVRDYEKD